MRNVMPLASMIRAVGLIALLATTVQAQDVRPFQNSWFWGAKVGTMSIATSETSRTWAPSIGADWLITRNAGGLYVFADHTSFDVRTSVADPAATPDSRRDVALRNLRRFGFAAFVSPRAFGVVRPYAGLGMSLNLIGRANSLPDEDGNTAGSGIDTAIEDERSRAAVLGLAGLQAQFFRFSAFTQVNVTPASTRFLINDGPMIGVDLGLRYNFGTSIGR